MDLALFNTSRMTEVEKRLKARFSRIRCLRKCLKKLDFEKHEESNVTKAAFKKQLLDEFADLSLLWKEIREGFDELSETVLKIFNEDSF
jgi:uncharacterized protein with HEPN domain